MTPIEGAHDLMKGLGAEALSGYIKQAAGVEIGGMVVSSAFAPLEVDRDTKEVEVLGSRRPALAIVTHGWDVRNPEARMMNWIPEIKESPSYGTPERHILSAFGIVGLKNFEYLRGRFRVRQPIPATEMNLGSLGNKWIFEDYDRRDRDSFNRLRETIWVIGMLPKSVAEEALNNKGHFLLVSEMIGEAEGNGEGQITAMAAITKGTDRVLVEGFSLRQIENFVSGYIERNTPVVVLRYH